MVSASEGLIYYCAVFLTALVFLTEASAITTNYEKSPNSQNRTQAPATHTHPSSQRTKSALTRNRTNLFSKHQNHDRINPILLTKLKSNAKIEIAPRTKLQQIDEILLSSNSGGENEIKDKGGGGNIPDDDDQKTLFQQVADGKYGLIQNEIFAKKPQRLGVISYDVNPEVPKDNINNLGGLESEDIWLAENHLLVLAGSRLNGNPWTPIDNYVAPNRPVKIPPNPKVPPPFPVQLSENGPIEYIGSLKRPQQQSPPGIIGPLHLQYANFNASAPNHIATLYGKLPYGSVGAPIKSSFPPIANLPPPPLPANVKSPAPGAEFIPPYLGITNQSEIIDEDDPSLYYPPPYDFYYPKDNTSKVPVGPLVPGIVMPPPPNFFSSFDNVTTSGKSSKYTLEKPADKPYKIGKQLQYANNSKSPLQLISTTTTGAPPPSWHPTNYLIYNEIINEHSRPTNDEELTRPSMKEDDANSQLNWIPIPAPTPLYITGPRKPITNTLLVMTDPLKSPVVTGYAYNRPNIELTLPEKKQKVKFVQHSNDENNAFPVTTPFSIYPQILSTQLPPMSSTTPMTPAYTQPPTIKATYYFYEEPKFVNVGQSSTSALPPPPTTTVDTLTEYHEQLPKIHSDHPSENIKDKGKFDDKKRKSNTPFIPIYYLAELDNAVDYVKPAGLPESTHVPQREYYTSTAKPAYAISKPYYEQATPQPIVEYNYVASNYNNNPAGSLVDSTLRPIQPTTFNTPSPVSNYPFDFDNYYGHQHRQPQQQQAPPPVKFSSLQSHYSIFQMPVHTTATPILFLDHLNQYAPPKNYDRPWVQDLNLHNKYGYAAYPTENPYYAFFTKEDADLIDENTKKYFTIFGQKIKHPAVESTSPLPVVQTLAAPETDAARWNTKYRTYKKYPSQSSPNTYSIFSTTTVPYDISTSADPQSESQILSTGDANQPLHSSARYNRPQDTNLFNTNAEYLRSTLAKRIRPIVVQDLPADLNERLRNIMSSQNRELKFPNHRPNTSSHPQFRYTLIDNAAYDNRPYRYSEYFLNKFQNGYREEEPSSTVVSLRDDLRVNYERGQKLLQDPDAEYVRTASRNVGTIRKGNEDDSYDEGPTESTVISLHDDVRVNYKRGHQLPEDPDAEYVRTASRNVATKVRQGNGGDDSYDEAQESTVDVRVNGGEHVRTASRNVATVHRSNNGDALYDEAEELSTPKLISLENDVLVNYKKPHPTNPDAEYIHTDTTTRHHTRAPRVRTYSSNRDKEGSASYRGSPNVEHARFYFLTQPETHLTEIEDERYDAQSNVEKPSPYIKRVITKPKTVRTICTSSSCPS